MSIAVVYSRGLSGIHAPQVTVEAFLANGLPHFTIVGLADAEVKEARDRVRSAILTARYKFPLRRVTVNLAPADLPKDSGRFDLPIALAILAASGQLPKHDLERYEFVGELALTGLLRPVHGVLPMSIAVAHAQRVFMVPKANTSEAALVPRARIYAADNLVTVCAHLSNRAVLPLIHGANLKVGSDYPDLADIKGQQQAKRALEIAAAGGHSLLMVGAPGIGKSMLAKTLPGLLPTLKHSAALEIATLQSLSSAGFDPRRFGQRPYRAPHHSASMVALVGGGSPPKPGEVSLAHHGVLFLDELPEFDRRALEALREPLENQKIVISRAAQQAEFPAAFQFIAAMNPCPCGYFNHPSGRCQCTSTQINRYRRRLSGPLLERIDLIIFMPLIHWQELDDAAHGEPSETVRKRVITVVKRQLMRQRKYNSQLMPTEVDNFCVLDATAKQLLKQVIEQRQLSARTYHRMLKVARTVADVEQKSIIDTYAIAEAIQYQPGLPC